MDIKTEVYLNMAKEAARLSKDANTKVGCVIVDVDGIVVSTGRNGPVRGIDDTKIAHSREEEEFHFREGECLGQKLCVPNYKNKTIKSNKYKFYLHSECNAILFCDDKKRLVGSTIYVTGMPCNNCALMLAQCGVSKVVIPEDGGNIKMMDEDAKNISKYIFANSDISLYHGDIETIFDI